MLQEMVLSLHSLMSCSIEQRGETRSGPAQHAGSLPEERTIAMVFLPVKPKAFGDVFPYFFRET